MKIRAVALATMLLLASGLGAAADTLLLVQGYLGSAASWRLSGVSAVLTASGWRDGGHLGLGPRGVFRQGPGPEAARRFYTLDLPTEAPVHVQAAILGQYLDYLAARHKGEKIFIAGHSAGGVVARYHLVRAGAKRLRDENIAALITIASPHLGTGAAETGLAVGQSPLSLLTPLFGGETINRSQQLYSELVPERPGTMLGWLNRQPHPAIEYLSIVRRAGGDEFVPEWSQDMNRVAALRGRSKRVITPPGHALRADDGRLIAGFLRGLRAAVQAERRPPHIRAIRVKPARTYPALT